MKKLLTTTIIAGLMSLVALPAMAAPDHYNHGHGHGYNKNDKHYYKKHDNHGHQKHWNNGRYNNNPHYQFRPSHDWRRGQVLNSNYRGQGYWVDYRQHPRLYAPAHNQRWVHVNGDYILVNTLSNVIVRILTGY